jgi:prepilin-type N-terminal cleavage/methylation domain-containing protein
MTTGAAETRQEPGLLSVVGVTPTAIKLDNISQSDRARIWWLRPEDRCGGFTLVEVLVALAIAAFAFLALTAGLMAAIRVAGLQKTRADGNEIATEAIEDLQRLDYDHLGVCTPPSGLAPAGLTSPVYLANCSNPTYAQPCSSAAGEVPTSSYFCPRRGVVYQVRRYIAWADNAHTVKRLAVLVDWTDQGGTHTITQESSLRSPDQGSVVGLAAPAFSATSVLVNGVQASTSNPVKLVDGVVQTPLTFSATTTGIPDGVFVTFLTRGQSGPVAATLPLVSSGAPGAWSVTIPAGSTQFVFGAGSQYVTFVTTRSADGKVNSQPNAQALTLAACQPGLTSCAASPNPPALSAITVTPSAPRIDSAGLLCSGIGMTLSAAASNLAPSDSVTATFQTLGGPYSVALASTDGTTWTGTIPTSAGYRFSSGSQPVYITAAQAYAPTANPPSYGSTAAAPSTPVSFGGACP